MFSPIRQLLVAIAATAVLACGDSGTNPSASVAGTYSLESFNGKSLPFAIADTEGTVVYTITYMAPFSITLNADNSVRLISTANFSGPGINETSSDTIGGTWKLAGTIVEVTTVDGDFFDLAWNGSNTLTITSPPDVLIFRK
jgi:hypothetical protein